MDDFVLWSAEKEELKRSGREIEAFLRERLALELKPRELKPVESGVSFLGMRVYPGGIRLGSRARLRFKRKFEELTALYRRGALSECEFADRARVDRAYRASEFENVSFARLCKRGTDPIGSNRVLRGGSWNNDPRNCRSAYRNYNDPANRNSNNGFLLARAARRSVARGLAGQEPFPSRVGARDEPIGRRAAGRRVRRSRADRFYRAFFALSTAFLRGKRGSTAIRLHALDLFFGKNKK